ncbi:MAG: 50S ribosomal protein L11 methyltransferase, partial [Clostridiales Family XIII bacterium]|nr:50S ribosomal protein L11 methyltransferase [Clostridiales Family XIII bacterium]
MSISDCPHAGLCGGCTYQGVPYTEQLDIKNSQVLDFLLQNDIRCGEYHPMQPSPHITAYRNKMEYSFGDEVKDGPMTLGLHKAGSYMSVIETDGCMIVPADFDVIRIAVLDYARRSGHGFHKKRTHSGFLRNLVLRRGERTDELLVNLITTDEETLDEDAFTALILGLPLAGRVVGILHTINNGRADTVACDSYKILHGRDHYFEELMGLRFGVGAFSFFQTNTSAVEHMFHEALEMLPDIANKKVFDVYCGTGTISLALSGKAGEVIGVEIVEDSVRAAGENAASNG